MKNRTNNDIPLSLFVSASLCLSLSVTLDFIAHSLCRLITKTFLTKTTCLIKFYKIVTHNGVKTSHLRIQIFIKYIKTNQEQTKKINVLPVISKSKCHAEVFLKVSQNSQENICARVSFLIKMQISEMQLY